MLNLGRPDDTRAYYDLCTAAIHTRPLRARNVTQLTVQAGYQPVQTLAELAVMCGGGTRATREDTELLAVRRTVRRPLRGAAPLGHIERRITQCVASWQRTQRACAGDLPKSAQLCSAHQHRASLAQKRLARRPS
jgi:hypothetical protein